MTDYTLILTREFPDAEWSLNGDTYDGLTWLSDGDAPSQETLDALWPAVRDAAAWDAVRADRDERLAACDWTQVADAPLTAGEKQAWADYRQALRDIPQTHDNPADVSWPVPPA